MQREKRAIPPCEVFLYIFMHVPAAYISKKIYLCMYLTIHMQCLLTVNQYAYAYDGVTFTVKRKRAAHC